MIKRVPDKKIEDLHKNYKPAVDNLYDLLSDTVENFLNSNARMAGGIVTQAEVIGILELLKSEYIKN